MGPGEAAKRLKACGDPARCKVGLRDPAGQDEGKDEGLGSCSILAVGRKGGWIDKRPNFVNVTLGYCRSCNFGHKS